jgi:hypothetical protein
MEIELVEFRGQTDVRAVAARYGIQNDMSYRVRIICVPKPPYEYMGTAKLSGFVPVIALYRGEEKEYREHPRHAVGATAMIDRIIRGDRPQEPSQRQEVTIVDISRGGVRIGAARGTLSVGDRFVLNLMISGKLERLVAEVMNTTDSGEDMAEYGCSLLGKATGDGNAV